MKDLIFNELSTQPYPANFEELNQRVANLVQLCKSANALFGFKKLRFTQELANYQLLENSCNFIDFLNDKRVKRTTKDLLMSLKRYPFIDDNDENVLSEYIENTFFLLKGNENIACDGLAVAYLYDTLAISLVSETIWEQIAISIFIKNEGAAIEKKVFHISKPEHLESENQLTNYLLGNIAKGISEITDLQVLYPNYTFENQAFEDLMYWKNQDKQTYERLHLLLKDIAINPAVGGLGKTEALKYRSGFSKRLTGEDRITYNLEGEGVSKKITIFACKGHYGDK